MAGAGASDRSPNQAAPAHGEREKHVPGAVAPHLGVGAGRQCAALFERPLRQLELSLPVYDALYAWCKGGGGGGERGVSLVRTGFVPIPAGAKRGFDHVDVHRAGRRLYVAYTGADRVDVIDCARRTFLRSPRLPGVAGVPVPQPTCARVRRSTRSAFSRS